MLTKRLQKILSVLPQCDTLADVGCDHGYIGIEALSRSLARQVIFVDISLPSLQKARQNCPEALKQRASFVCQDGLGAISADCAVIAGMGGLEILSVLQGAKALPQRLVLQPMRNQKDVRLWLCQSYTILSDQKFFDGKFYDLILAEKSVCGDHLTPQQISFGKTNLTHPTDDFVLFLQHEIAECQQILTQCNSDDVTQRLAAATHLLSQIKEVQQ